MPSRKASKPRPSSPGDVAARILTPYLRKKLKRPMGELFPASMVQSEQFLSVVASAAMVVTVGDRVTETLQELGRSPDLFVVDGRERREAREVPRVAHGTTIRAKNSAGTISASATRAIRKAFALDKPVMVLIDGEEDLLALPAILEAPTGAVVFYGQPLEGVVAVRVDARAREAAERILAGMRLSPLEAAHLRRRNNNSRYRGESRSEPSR